MIPETATPPRPIAPDRPLTGRAVKNAMSLCGNAHSLDLTRLRRGGIFKRPPGTTWASRYGYPAAAESEVVYFLLADESGPVGVGLVDYRPGTDPEEMVRAYGVPLSSTRCHFGGRRFWFLCPIDIEGRACLRRCRILYRPRGATYFGCRRCHRLTYEANKRHRQSFYEQYTRPFAALERFDRFRHRQRRPPPYRDVLRAERAIDELLARMARRKTDKRGADGVR